MFYVYYESITKQKGMLQKFQHDNLSLNYFSIAFGKQRANSITCLLLQQELQTTIQYKIQ